MKTIRNELDEIMRAHNNCTGLDMYNRNELVAYIRSCERRAYTAGVLCHENKENYGTYTLDEWLRIRTQDETKSTEDSSNNNAD